ncbi:MAG: chemotaxis protein CheW [Clostridiales Family XIII bacterium]|jgi:purine-binding chemotaxis protein CheW|nr:chemotaxis protein CheW [Clostridiales Family XIII bacterium]
MDKYLIFFAAGRTFGLDVAHIKEVGIPACPVRVPGAPDHVRGVIYRGGRVVPLIDFRMKLDAAEEPREQCAGVIYATANGERFGIIVDRIGDIVAGPDVGETTCITTVEDIVFGN